MSQTQRQKVLELLNQADWVCGTVFQNNYIPEYRSRCNELSKDGYIILKRRCTQHQHKGMMLEWRLETKAPASESPKPPVTIQTTSQPEKPHIIENTQPIGLYSQPKTFMEAYEIERKRKGLPLTPAEMKELAKKFK